MPTTVAGADVGSAPRPGKKVLGVVLLVLIYAAAAVLLLFPAVFLALGLQALGSKLGLWAGEATTNDGEESWAAVIGAVSSAVVLACAGIGAWAVARRHGLQPLRTVAIATAIMVCGHAVLLVPFFR